MGRSKGYVSEHLSGVRAVDTDMLDGIAELADVDVSWLVDEVSRRMRSEVGETASRIAREARETVRENRRSRDGDSDVEIAEPVGKIRPARQRRSG